MDKLSAVLIMKNEEIMLPRCLDSLKNAVDEIVIVDTGSTDSSVEIAKRYTDKIFFRAWDDSFCNARNFALSHATGDWIISVDCDEVLHDGAKLREAVALGVVYDLLAINVKMIAEGEGQSFSFPRLFKRSPRVWWEGHAHNHISVPGTDVGNVEITHGYSPAHFLDKDRTMRILEKVVKETMNPREMFYLGREYWYRNMYDKALLMLGQYVQRSQYLAEKADAFLIMARCYWNLRMANDARDACVQALICNANFKEAALFMAELAGDGTGNEDWQKNANQWKQLAATADNYNVLFVRT